MSYDLSLGPDPASGQQPENIGLQLGFSMFYDDWPEMPDPILTSQQDRTTTELCDLYSDFEKFTSNYDYSELGRGKGRCIELTLSCGLQIVLYSDSAWISVPYWYKHEDAVRAVFERIRKCIAVIEDVMGYVTDDPQVGRIVNVPADLDIMIGAYLQTMGLIDKHIIQNIGN